MDSIFLLLVSALIILSSCKEYEFVSKPKSGCDAQYYCEQQFAGNLASITSDAENNQVAALCAADNCLIGLENIAAHSLSFWMNGEQVSYTNWGQNEPDKEGDQPRVVINSNDKTWRTVSKVKFPFVCEKNSPVYVTVHQMEFQVYSGGDTLLPNQQLTTDQALVDTNGRYVAALQSDGNFVIYDLLQDDASLGPGKWVWATNTGFPHDPNRYLVLQGSDGNLVLYSGGSPNTARWASHQHSSHPKYLIMQTDGNLVAYDTNNHAYFHRFSEDEEFFNLDFVNNGGSFLTTMYEDVHWMIIVAIIGILCVIFGVFYYRKNRVKDQYQSFDDE